MIAPIPARTSDAYTPCVVLEPGREPVRGNVMAGRMMAVDAARAEYAAGRVVWVAPGDVEAVRGEGGITCHVLPQWWGCCCGPCWR